MYACIYSDSGMLFCREFAYAITASGDCLYLLVLPLAHAVLLFDVSVLAQQLHVLNRWAREKSTLCNFTKSGADLFLKVVQEITVQGKLPEIPL